MHQDYYFAGLPTDSETWEPNPISMWNHLLDNRTDGYLERVAEIDEDATLERSLKMQICRVLA